MRLIIFNLLTIFFFLPMRAQEDCPPSLIAERGRIITFVRLPDDDWPVYFQTFLAGDTLDVDTLDMESFAQSIYDKNPYVYMPILGMEAMHLIYGSTPTYSKKMPRNEFSRLFDGASSFDYSYDYGKKGEYNDLKRISLKSGESIYYNYEYFLGTFIRGTLDQLPFRMSHILLPDSYSNNIFIPFSIICHDYKPLKKCDLIIVKH